MTELENLFLPNNDISDIGVLENLMKLRYLNLEENSIVDTSPLWALSQGDCTIYLEEIQPKRFCRPKQAVGSRNL